MNYLVKNIVSNIEVECKLHGSKRILDTIPMILLPWEKDEQFFIRTNVFGEIIATVFPQNREVRDFKLKEQGYILLGGTNES